MRKEGQKNATRLVRISSSEKADSVISAGGEHGVRKTDLLVIKKYHCNVLEWDIRGFLLLDC